MNKPQTSPVLAAAPSHRVSNGDMVQAAFIAALFGVSFVIVKYCVQFAPPLFLSGLRFLGAALPCIFFLRPPATSWRIIIGYGFTCGVGQFGLIFTAIALGMPSGLVSLMVQTQAIFTMIFAYYFFRQPVQREQILGTLTAMVGLAVIGQGIAVGPEPISIVIGRFAAVIGAALSFSFANLFAIRAGSVNTTALTAWGAVFAAPMLFALSWTLEDHARIINALVDPVWTMWLGVAFMAYGAQVVGFSAWSRLLSRNPAARITPFALLVPVFGMSCAALTFHERLSGQSMIGASIVFLGLGMVIFWRR